MAACRAIDTVTPIDFGRQSPPTAIHDGPVDGQSARANEVGTVATIDGSRCLIAEGSGSKVSRIKVATSKRRRATAVTSARPSTNPSYAARCADIATTPAIVAVSLRVNLAAVGRTTIAVGVAGAASDATGATRAGSRAVVARAYSATDSTIARVSRERLFATVRRTAVAVSVQIGAGAHRTGTTRAGGCCMGIGTNIRASTAMVHVGTGVLFATIGGIAVAAGVPRTAGRHTTSRCTGSGTMSIRAGVAAGATVGCSIESHFATVGGRAVTIPVTCIAGAKLAGRGTAHT